MNRFVIQVSRDGEWCNVTTIPFESGNNRLDADAKYRRAYREASLMLSRWAGYFTDPLRIAEPTITGGYKEVAP
jgi:hypothetical protein